MSRNPLSTIPRSSGSRRQPQRPLLLRGSENVDPNLASLGHAQVARLELDTLGRHSLLPHTMMWVENGADIVEDLRRHPPGPGQERDRLDMIDAQLADFPDAHLTVLEGLRSLAGDAAGRRSIERRITGMRDARHTLRAHHRRLTRSAAAFLKTRKAGQRRAATGRRGRVGGPRKTSTVRRRRRRRG